MCAIASDGGKVWLVGTSAGTMSAASIAARLPRLTPPTKDNLRRPDGIVLTATQTTVVKGLCGRTVFNAQLSAVNVPALLAHHRGGRLQVQSDELCRQGARRAHRRARQGQHGTFSGGLPPKSKDPCMAMTPHGFLGIEDKVVEAIADFIRKH